MEMYLNKNLQNPILWRLMTNLEMGFTFDTKKND